MGLTSCAGFYSHMGVSQAKCSKLGVAQKRVWFGLAFNVDLSIETAAKNGGITKVANVDFVQKPGLFSMLYITKVCGE